MTSKHSSETLGGESCTEDTRGSLSGSLAYAAVSFALLLLAFYAMPEGPWYRQIPAAVLCGWAHAAFMAAIE